MPTIVERHLDSFREMIEGEAWKVDDQEARAWEQVDHLLKFASYIYDEMVDLDEGWREDVHSSIRDYSAETHSGIDDLFRTWVDSSDRLAKVVQAGEERGFYFDNAAAFRKRRAEAAWALADPADLFDHDRFRALRDRAVEEHEAGQTAPLDTLWE